MNAADIIALFGGVHAVAKRFGASRTAVCNWRRDGIPSKLWPAIVKAAEADKDKPGVTFETVTWRPSRVAVAA